jgi:hypothetical protein
MKHILISGAVFGFCGVMLAIVIGFANKMLLKADED